MQFFFVVLETVGNYHLKRLKFEEEARVLFGYSVTGADNIKFFKIILFLTQYVNIGNYRETVGYREGYKLNVIDYTNRLVVGFARYDSEIKRELSKKLNEGKILTKILQNDRCLKGGYKARYIWEVVFNSFFFVKEFIDHIWNESNALYAGTDMADKFMIYHDVGKGS